ncbi:glucan 1,3-beta-glucosidase (glycosyl hydrolase family 17) [Colletotrichum tofieldiae]|uniref:glucan 1,3-beta-glucosidase n=1 Tax=Colletotrichum tofieldiae TaxID=708197 RepID=A0A166XF16_9PEZI|nr:glucan 1,3-beta-glucosidase (glycosyl hydrolase family 17) [Colletotrichum tofieldiae]GKT95242.1 glucan 1,3-beta-glucosidase [Colletotrichum tofieldiae]
MRFTPVIAVILAAAPGPSLASGSLGFALGAKQPDGRCKYQADYEADFKAIRDASGSSVVRIYAADQCNTAQQILPAAKKEDFQVILGIWYVYVYCPSQTSFPVSQLGQSLRGTRHILTRADRPDTEESYAADKAAILRYTPGYEGQVYAVTVGSESLYRGNLTGTELADKLKDMKKSTPHFKIGSADSWNKYQDGTADAVIRQADILLTNAFSYWQGQTRDNATACFFDSIMQAFGRIQRVSGSTNKPELWVGETGWPSDGAKYQKAVPGHDNAQAFYGEGVCGMVKWGFNVFFFEAFDEPWKPHAVGEDGSEAPETHWGGMKADRTAKYSLIC